MEGHRAQRQILARVRLDAMETTKFHSEETMINEHTFVKDIIGEIV